MLTNRGWTVYCCDTETVIGVWDKYADAEQFWSDAMCAPDADEYHWAVFPTLELTELVDV